MRTSCWIFLLTMSSMGARAASFDDIYSSLESRAFEQSPDLRSAEASYDQAAGHNYAAWAKWGPRINLQLSKTRSKDYSLLTSGSLPANFPISMDPQQVDLDRWSLVASFPIYNRSVHLGAVQALWEKRLAARQLDVKRSELKWKIKQLLGNYIVAAYRKAVSESGLKTARESAREMKIRFDIGQKTKIDVLRADSNLASLESRWISSQEQLASERFALADGTGLTTEELDQIGLAETQLTEGTLIQWIERFAQSSQSGLTRIQPYLDMSAEKRSALAVESSPHYEVLRSQGEVSDTRARLPFAVEWPDLALQGSFGKQTPNWSDAFEPGQRSYSVGLTLTVPLFSWGSSIATYKESSAGQEAARIQNARDVKRFFNTLESQNVQIKSLSKSVEANALRAQQNEEILRLSTKSHQLGKTSTVDLLSAQNDLLNAKVELAESRVKLAVLLGQFAWNLGVQQE